MGSLYQLWTSTSFNVVRVIGKRAFANSGVAIRPTLWLSHDRLKIIYLRGFRNDDRHLADIVRSLQRIHRLESRYPLCSNGYYVAIDKVVKRPSQDTVRLHSTPRWRRSYVPLVLFEGLSKQLLYMFYCDGHFDHHDKRPPMSVYSGAIFWSSHNA